MGLGSWKRGCFNYFRVLHWIKKTRKAKKKTRKHFTSPSMQSIKLKMILWNYDMTKPAFLSLSSTDKFIFTNNSIDKLISTIDKTQAFKYLGKYFRTLLNCKVDRQEFLIFIVRNILNSSVRWNFFLMKFSHVHSYNVKYSTRRK